MVSPPSPPVLLAFEPPPHTIALTPQRPAPLQYSGPVPPAPTPPGQKEVKPILQGVRNKQRKGVTKANAKFEPTQFRDQLIKHLESVPPGDLDAVAAKLDALGNTLDYRKYEQQLFEILLVGGILAPGGGFADDASSKSTFSVIASTKYPLETADVKKVADVFNKLMRRYKYLQMPFEESALKGILQYANKFSSEDQEKLAAATAVFVTLGLAPANVLTALKKDHLLKDLTALNFLTTFLRTFLLIESLDSLSSALRKSQMTDLEAFFPPSKQNATELSNHFNTYQGGELKGVTDFWFKLKVAQAKEDWLAKLKEMVQEEEALDDIQSYLRTQFKKALIPEPDFIALVWNGLVSGLDLGSPAGQLVDLTIKEAKHIAPALEEFAKKPATEVALINTIQIWCYENTKLMPAFAKLLKVLYSEDVLSDQAVIYWHSKGAKPQGKVLFLKAAEPLVKFLQEQDEEEESDDE